MFVDVAKIHLKAGNGGNGCVSFHREKYVAAGGPDGGDGGHGGNIVFKKDDNLSTLADFRYKTKYTANSGQDGRAGNCNGKKAEDLIISVPCGTVIKEAESGQIIADISDNEEVIVARGGKGGFGNSHFATPTRQVPRFAKPGIKGEEFDVILELKLLADVGLIGFPNVGKSTLVSVVSEAKPKIANYHFTTLTPVLGVVRIDDGASFVMADIPGLIEGAGDGVGLGTEFLRHVERCRILLHILDISGSEGRNPYNDFDKINAELKKFSEPLAKVKQIVVANKCDLCDEETVKNAKEYFENKGYEFFSIMAAIGEGTRELINFVKAELDKLPPLPKFEVTYERNEMRSLSSMPKTFTVRKENDIYYVENCEWIEPVMNNVNPDDYESLQYFERVLRQSGIIKALEKAGVEEGDTVSVNDFEFTFVL